MSDQLAVEVVGMTPIGQGRMTGYPIRGKGGKLHVQMVHSNAELLKPWRKAVALAARAAAARQGWVGDARDVMLEHAVWSFARPAAHYRTGRYRHLLRDDAPARPTGQQYGDLDHLMRACLDALTQSGVIADDKHVVATGYMAKEFGDPAPPGVALRLRRVE